MCIRDRVDTVGGHDGTLVGNVGWKDSPAAGSKPVNGAAADVASGAIDITGLPLDLAPGAVNSVSFWMYWDGTSNGMPIGFGSHDLWFRGNAFGFNTFNSDVYGILSAGLENGWHHVAAVFTNGNVAANKLWCDGGPQGLSKQRSSPNNSNAYAKNTFQLSCWRYNNGYRFAVKLDERCV